ncbi:Las1-like-domain-containing protein [Endogone sp. FLAS-F59071]|nr:Las1-like-domain-containing protein [Endogone sp. FLAS-F59071]|eukprot:RUS17970.1 Las1-like-domain-containing protein [Endogone sp. FLAS-F59071]
MPRIPRIVPWTSHKEFQAVCQWLYDTDHPNQRELGVKRVRAWSSRGRVPHAVDCTASFVEALLRDRLAARPRLSQHELRSMYSMTFVRFVNGIVDPAQQGAFAQSVAGIAERMNLPLWFVELRHASTHEQLPSLQALRSGCEQALQWLYDNYWALSLRNGIEDSDDLQKAVSERSGGMQPPFTHPLAFIRSRLKKSWLTPSTRFRSQGKASRPNLRQAGPRPGISSPQGTRRCRLS